MKEKLVEFVLWILSLQGNANLLPWAFNRIQRLFEGEPVRYLDFLKSYGERNRWFFRFFAAHQLGSVYPKRGDEVLELLQVLSEDENDLVLEAAAHSWSRLLEEDFDKVISELETLRQSGTYRERRTAALAPVEYYRDGAPGVVERRRMEEFWDRYKDDPKQGLVNLVETQIVQRIVTDDT